MAMATASRRFVGPLLFVNLVMYVIVLCLAGWSIDKYIDRQTHRRYLLMFSLLAAAIGACSALAGPLHPRAWRSSSLASALSSSLVSSALTVLQFGLACKQISLGNRGRRLRTLEAFVVILTFMQLFYLFFLHAGISSRYGPSYRNYGTME